MNEPKLRFKADDGSQFPDWEEKTIDEVAECLDNKRVPVNSEERKKRVGIIPYYGAGGIQGYIDDYLFDEELVLLLEDGDAFDDFQTKSIAQYVTGKSWVNNHAHVLRANGNSYFLFASLEHKDIRKWTQLAGASRKKLLKDSMLKITVNMPSLPEQQKIADFLSTIDTVIAKQKETVSAWEERKKGVMQKLFSQEVRFKADNGSEFPEWEEKKLGDITSQYKVRNKKRLPLEIYSVNNIVGFIPQSEQFDDAGYLKDTDTSIYMIVPPKHFAYNPARLDVGSIGYQYLDHDVQVSSLYEVFETSNLVNDEFLWSWFHTHYFNNVVKRLQEGGVRLYFYYDKMQEVKIGLPSLPEQQKIADCLSSLDEVIEKQKATLAAWEELKKGLLQQMFV